MTELKTEHLQYLAARGITDPEVIQSRGYASEDTGLKIPVWSLPDGDLVSWELRLDTPGEDGRKFTRPKGSGNHLNINPRMLTKVRDAKHTLLVVEGTTRADALAQRGIPAVSLTGCWGWLDKKQGTLNEWRDIPISGRNVIWVPDGDAFTNPDVNKATHEFITFLRRKGAKHISLLAIPDGKGLDDWFAAGGDLLGMSDLRISPEDLPELAPTKLSRDRMAQKKGLPDTTDEALAELWVLSDPTHAVRIKGSDSWLTYTDGHWQHDRTREGLDARTSLAQLMNRVAEKYMDAADTDAEKAVAAATYRDLKSARKLASVYSRFKTLPSEMVTARDEDFDQDPFLFNCSNGTVDLRTAQLQEHNPADRLRGQCPTAFNPEATAPRWEQFLAEVFPDQPDTISYLQLLLGASLLGRPVLHVLPVFVGTGRNGKGTLVRALTAALGRDYMGACDRTLLISSKFESHPTKLMALKGKRLVTASETEAGERLASASLKMLTGGDEISARGMREDQQTFMPSHNMILMTNNLPEVDSSDKALWARLKLINFTQSFEDNPDRFIDQKLAAEAEGILLWLVNGCKRFLDGGMEIEDPMSVIASTGDWRMDGDSFGQFVSARLKHDPKGQTLFKDILDAYQGYCSDQGLSGAEVVSPTQLGRLLGRLPNVKKTLLTERRLSGYSGLLLLSERVSERVSATEGETTTPHLPGKRGDGDGGEEKSGVEALTETHPTEHTTGPTEGAEKPAPASQPLPDASDQQKQQETIPDPGPDWSQAWSHWTSGPTRGTLEE